MGRSEMLIVLDNPDLPAVTMDNKKWMLRRYQTFGLASHSISRPFDGRQ